MGGAALWSRPVMVVEDDPTIGELLTLRLDLAGYRPTWVRDGAQALERINEVKPDLIVLDLGLPKVDGFQVLEALRAEPLWRDLPIIVLTARHNSEDVRKALSLGASDYMAKPFDAKRLQQRIERQLALAPVKR
ncbi:MAG TPA: response regulator [Caulobacteraceae bacterium]|jgi:DNA-binding response OmpR family regulator|nr:response regulator [Caulobacteraceae bacterium]